MASNDYHRGYTAGKKYHQKEIDKLKRQIKDIDNGRALSVFNAALQGILSGKFFWRFEDEKKVESGKDAIKLAKRFVEEAKKEGVIF